ncbi:unnamed protein product [Absidia cylindrospora]
MATLPKRIRQKTDDVTRKHTQQKKEEEDALLASLGPEPSAADVIDFLITYLHLLIHPLDLLVVKTIWNNIIKNCSNSKKPQQYQLPLGHHLSPTIIFQNRYPAATNPYYQQPQQQYQQQQQQPVYGQPPQPSAGYPVENAIPSGQYYPPASSASPRPSRPYDPRMVRPQYAPQPQQYYPSPQQQHQPHATAPTPRPMYAHQQQQQQQRPMAFPGSSYQPQPRPMYSNQPRPMYRPNGAPSMGNGNGGVPRPMANSPYYRPGPPGGAPAPPPPQGYPPQGYPMQGRSPTLNQQRVPYGYNGAPATGISRSSTQNSSQGRYS